MADSRTGETLRNKRAEATPCPIFLENSESGTDAVPERNSFEPVSCSDRR
jgi:hypothetical protein